MIESVGDFLNIIDELYPERGEAFFRGQASSNFDVSSSLCRFISGCNDSVRKSPKNFSTLLFEDFEEKLPVYPESYFLKNHAANKIDILMTAQHYGMPTRLIDWTKNPLIALYFAAEDIEKDEYMSVFLLKNNNERKLKKISSNYFLSGILCDRKVIIDLHEIITESISFVLGAEVTDSYNDEKVHLILGGLITKIGNVINRAVMECSGKSLLDFHDGKYENFFELGSYINKKIKSIAGDRSNYESYNVLLYNLEKIKRLLRLSISNHRAGVAGINLYGNDHLILEPLPINNRIKSQQGFFLFSKKCDVPEFFKENFVDGENCIKSKDDINIRVRKQGVIRIDIKRSLSEKIKKELSRYGVCAASVYPELASFCKETKSELWYNVRKPPNDKASPS